jgi:hypothetical protein
MSNLECRKFYLFVKSKHLVVVKCIYVYVVFASHGMGLCAITQKYETHKDNTEVNASKISVRKGKHFLFNVLLTVHSNIPV